jgi:hypothetical protein
MPFRVPVAGSIENRFRSKIWCQFAAKKNRLLVFFRISACLCLQRRKNPQSLYSCGFAGILERAGDGTRTHDINLGKVALYQLSYTRRNGLFIKCGGRALSTGKVFISHFVLVECSPLHRGLAGQGKTLLWWSPTVKSR